MAIAADRAIAHKAADIAAGTAAVEKPVADTAAAEKPVAGRCMMAYSASSHSRAGIAYARPGWDTDPAAGSGPAPGLDIDS